MNDIDFDKWNPVSICSRHPIHVDECELCQVLLVIPLNLIIEAETAGLHKCECGFDYYKTVDSCPLCQIKRVDI